jgi:hypothetical protein
VLTLLRESGNYLRSLTVGSNTREAALETKAPSRGRSASGGTPINAQEVEIGFDSYAQSDAMRDRIMSLP